VRMATMIAVGAVLHSPQEAVIEVALELHMLDQM